MREHIPALDGVRGIAILLVLSFHGSLFPLGWAGVDLFFVLSGFLITGILVRTRERERYFSAFYMRRFLRVLPVFVLSMAAVTVVCSAIAESDSELAGSAREILAAKWWLWSQTANIKIAISGDWLHAGVNHVWSLAVEEQYYLVYPVLVWLLPPRKLGWLCAVAILLSTVARPASLLMGVSPKAVYVLPWYRMDTLMLGGLLALGHRAGMLRRFRGRHLGGCAVACGAGLVWVCLHDGAGLTAFWMQSVGMVLITCLCGVFLVAAVTSHGRLARVLGGPRLGRVGKLSYAMYLFHMPIAIWAFHTFPANGRLVRFAASMRLEGIIYTAILFVLSFAAAGLSWVLLESHCLKLKRFFRPADKRSTA